MLVSRNSSCSFIKESKLPALGVYLESTDEMDDDAYIPDVDEPKWIVEAESCQEVAGRSVPKRSISQHTTQHVEGGGGEDPNGGGLLHHLVFRWTRSQSILSTIHQNSASSYQ